MVSLPKNISAAGGSATETPMVETIRISDDASRRCLKSSR